MLLVCFVILISFSLPNLASSGASIQFSQTGKYTTTLSGVPQAKEYSLTLSGVPSGGGTYQQLITLNPVNYGISSSGGNVMFFDKSNGTELYAWLQSIDNMSVSYWIRNYDSSLSITMQVVSGANYFSARGYLGEAPQLSLKYAQYDNGNLVFPYYYNFVSNIGNLTLLGTSNIYSFNNGLNYSSNTTNFSSELISPFILNWVHYTEIENVKVSGYGNNIGSGYIVFAGERNSVNSSAYQSYVEAYINGLDISDYNGTYNGVQFSGINTNYFNIEWGSLSNSSAYVQYNGKITYNAVGTERKNINPLNWYTYKGYYEYIHYLAISDIPMTLMPTFTIGSGKALYAISFTESGLFPETDWSVILNNITKNSTNRTITFYEPNGSSTYIIQSIFGYTTANYLGTITVNGNSINQNIVWSVMLFSITIIAFGIPNGTSWSLTLTGTAFNGELVNTTHSSNNCTITIYEPNGNYTYDIHLPSSYFISNSSEALNVSGYPVSSIVIVKQADISTRANYIIFAIVTFIIIISIVGVVIIIGKKKC